MTAMLLKLINGDEIIGDVNISNLNTETIEVTDALIIESKSNNGGIAFVLNKYLPFSNNKTIKVNNDTVIAIADISNDMKEYWRVNVDYVNSTMVPSMELNIKRGLQYFTASLIDDYENNETEFTDEEIMEELLRELKPPSDLKH